jgi:hypothetical protein
MISIGLFLYAFSCIAFVAPHEAANVVSNNVDSNFLGYLGLITSNVIIALIANYSAKKTKALELEYKLEKKDEDYDNLAKKYVYLLEEMNK